MAVSTIIAPNNVELVFTSATDWNCATNGFPKGMVLHSIKIKGTVGDIIVFREKGTSATLNPKICHMADVAGQGVKDTFSSAKINGDKIYRFPVFCSSEATVSSWSALSVMIEYEL